MKCNNKNAFSLFELILVLFISSIVLIYSFSFTKELYETQITNEKIAILKIDLNSTKIILQRNLPLTNKLKYEGTTLYLNNNILLKNVSSFDTKTSSGFIKIDITLEDTIKQTWQFKL